MTKKKRDALPNDPVLLGVPLPVTLTLRALQDVRDAWATALAQVLGATRGLVREQADRAEAATSHEEVTA